MEIPAKVVFMVPVLANNTLLLNEIDVDLFIFLTHVNSITIRISVSKFHAE